MKEYHNIETKGVVLRVGRWALKRNTGEYMMTEGGQILLFETEKDVLIFMDVYSIDENEARPELQK